MPQAEQLDSLTLDSLVFPYDRITGELRDEPRLIRGLNMFTTRGQKLTKRSGTKLLTDSDHTAKAVRVVSYETLDTPAKVYYLASFYTGTDYEVRYLDLDAGTPAWTSVGTLRDVDDSTRPNELLVHKGKVYIKSYPGSGDKYGTVVWESVGGTPALKLWGLPKPTEPVHIAAPGTWSVNTNAHTITVRFGWKYAYAWVSSTGHVSSRSPQETNPDVNPSDTGAFTFAASAGKCPEVVVQGHADTTNIPYINIYRTFDGGGSFYFLAQIANSGSGNITYVDDDLESGAGGGNFDDPIPDTVLDISQKAPDTVTNDPPPSVNPPSVVGTANVAPSTHMVSWAGRIWYAIGSRLHYSSNEELDDGVGEEAFRSGLLGNFFDADHEITGFSPTKEALFVHTIKGTHWVRGSTKDTFDFRLYLNDIGGARDHSRAYCPVGEGAAWVTQDFRVAIVTETAEVSIVSDPLFTDIVDIVNAGAELEITHWSELEKDLLIVNAHNITTPSSSRQWVLDLKRSAQAPFWNVPWSINSTACCSGRASQGIINRRLVWAVWETNTMELVRWDPTGRTATDHLPISGNVGIDWYVDTWLITNPAGNHVNQLAKGHRTPVVERLIFDRSVFEPDVDPNVYYYLDDFWTSPKPTQAVVDPPARRTQVNTAYKTFSVAVNEAGYRIAIRLQKTADQRLFELHGITVVWEPGTSGPGGGA